MTSNFTAAAANGHKETPYDPSTLQLARRVEAQGNARETCCNREKWDVLRRSRPAAGRSSYARGADCNSGRHRQRQSSWRVRLTGPGPPGGGKIFAVTRADPRPLPGPIHHSPKDRCCRGDNETCPPAAPTP